MKRKIFLVVGIIATLLLAACGANNNSTASKEEDAPDIKQLVDDFSMRKIEDKSASISSHQLKVVDSDKRETYYDLPEEEFFVAIAPYIENNHP